MYLNFECVSGVVFVINGGEFKFDFKFMFIYK